MEVMMIAVAKRYHVTFFKHFMQFGGKLDFRTQKHSEAVLRYILKLWDGTCKFTGGDKKRFKAQSVLVIISKFQYVVRYQIWPSSKEGFGEMKNDGGGDSSVDKGWPLLIRWTPAEATSSGGFAGSWKLEV